MVQEKAEKNQKETSRIEAFSDGVFAIAITLLVLDIRVPVVKNDESLIQLLLKDWQTYLAFLIGFFTLLVCWINHHYMFEFIQKSNGILLLLNGFKLLVVSFTPFATALISEYIATPQQQTAVNIYTGNFFLMGLAMTGVWCYSYRKKFTKSVSPEVLKAVTRLYLIAPAISGLIFILSFINIWICLIVFAIMFVIFVFPKVTMMCLKKKDV